MIATLTIFFLYSQHTEKCVANIFFRRITYHFSIDENFGMCKPKEEDDDEEKEDYTHNNWRLI